MFVQTSGVKAPTILLGIICTISLLIISLFGSRYYYMLINTSLSISSKFIISRIILWLWLLLVYLYTLKIEKQPFLLWRENQYKIRFYFLSIILILLIAFVGSLVIMLLIIRAGWYNFSNIIFDVKNLSWTIKLLIVLTAAIVEEAIFRGYLIPRLQLFFKNIHLPILVSAGLFGLSHIGYGTINNMIGPFVGGMLLGYHYQKYRNIKILIICHFLVDCRILFWH